MNELTFTLTIDDCAAFSDHHLTHSPAGKRSRRAMQIGFALVFLGIGVFSAFGAGNVFVIIPYGVVAALWYVILPPLLRWFQRRQVLKLYGEGPNRWLLGRHRLRIEADGLVWSAETSDGRYKWAALERISRTPEYTFVNLSAVMALVIPRRAVTEGDYDSFVQALSERLEAAAAA